jgi:hypothetical protein
MSDALTFEPTPLQRLDWGFSTTAQLRVRPPRDVYAIGFAPDDEAGAVVVSGLPGPVPSYVITPERPWIGHISSSDCTLEFAPLYKCNSGTIAAFQHKLSLLLFHAPIVFPPTKRAPITRDLVIASGTGFATDLWMPVIGRKRFELVATVDGDGAIGAIHIDQNIMAGNVPMVPILATVYKRAPITGTKFVSWSPNKRSITSDSLGAGEVGQSSELDQVHLYKVSVNPMVGGTATVHMEAWD